MYRIKVIITTMSAKHIHPEKDGNIQKASSESVLPKCTAIFSLLGPGIYSVLVRVLPLSSSVNQFCNSSNIFKAMLNLVHLKRYFCYLYCVPSPMVVAENTKVNTILSQILTFALRYCLF